MHVAFSLCFIEISLKYLKFAIVMIDLFRNPMVAYFIIKKRREKSLLGILGIQIKTYTLAMNQIMVYNVKQFELKLNKFLVKTVQYYNIIKIKKA